MEIPFSEGECTCLHPPYCSQFTDTVEKMTSAMDHKHSEAKWDPGCKGSGNGVSHVITQEYDPRIIRRLQIIEESFLDQLSSKYHCDKIDLPVEVDVLGIFREPQNRRRPMLERMLARAPFNADALIGDLLFDLAELDRDESSQKLSPRK